MKIINNSVKLLTKVNREEVLKTIELAGRTAYRSEHRINEKSGEKFLKKIVKLGHLSVIEHYNLTFVIIGSRAMMTQLLRHRLASYTMESLRYVNKGKESIEFIDNPTIREKSLDAYVYWKTSLTILEDMYKGLLAYGVKPEDARTVLPLCTASKITVTMNLRQWLHVIQQRTSKHAQREIREVMLEVKDLIEEQLPELFIGD